MGWWTEGRRKTVRASADKWPLEHTQIMTFAQWANLYGDAEVLTVKTWRSRHSSAWRVWCADVDHPEVINVSFTIVHWSFATIFSKYFCREWMIIKLLILLNKAWLYRWSMITNLFFQALWLFSYAANQVHSLLQDSKQSIMNYFLFCLLPYVYGPCRVFPSSLTSKKLRSLQEDRRWGEDFSKTFEEKRSRQRISETSWHNSF